MGQASSRRARFRVEIALGAAQGGLQAEQPAGIEDAVGIGAGLPQALGLLQAGGGRLQLALDAQEIGREAARVAADAALPPLLPPDPLGDLHREPRPGRGFLEAARDGARGLLGRDLHQPPVLVAADEPHHGEALARRLERRELPELAAGEPADRLDVPGRGIAVQGRDLAGAGDELEIDLAGLPRALQDAQLQDVDLRQRQVALRPRGIERLDPRRGGRGVRRPAVERGERLQELALLDVLPPLLPAEDQVPDPVRGLAAARRQLRLGEIQEERKELEDAPAQRRLDPHGRG